MLIDEIGVCHVYTKGTDLCFSIHPSFHNAILAAWMKGEAFFQASDVYGDRMDIKLGTVEAIHLGTPDNLARYIAEKKIRDAEEALG